MKNWLENIRNADESVKQRWLFGLTGVSTIAIVFLWLGYMSLRIPEVAPPSGAKHIAAAQRQRPSTKSVFMAGFGAIANDVGSRLSRGMSRVKNAIGGENVIVIAPAPKNFVLGGVEEVPETPLP